MVSKQEPKRSCFLLPAEISPEWIEFFRFFFIQSAVDSRRSYKKKDKSRLSLDLSWPLFVTNLQPQEFPKRSVKQGTRIVAVRATQTLREWLGVSHRAITRSILHCVPLWMLAPHRGMEYFTRITSVAGISSCGVLQLRFSRKVLASFNCVFSSLAFSPPNMACDGDGRFGEARRRPDRSLIDFVMSAKLYNLVVSVSNRGNKILGKHDF